MLVGVSFPKEFTILQMYQRRIYHLFPIFLLEKYFQISVVIHFYVDVSMLLFQSFSSGKKRMDTCINYAIFYHLAITSIFCCSLSEIKNTLYSQSLKLLVLWVFILLKVKSYSQSN